MKNKIQLENEWSKLAGENIRIEIVRNSIYAFSSELACLRLYYKFRGMPKRMEVYFSENLQSWYFVMESR